MATIVPLKPPPTIKTSSTLIMSINSMDIIGMHFRCRSDQKPAMLKH